MKDEHEKREQEESKEEEDKPKNNFLPWSKTEHMEIKSKIYQRKYEDFLQIYQGNIDRVKPLCLLLDLEFNPEDPNESLKAIFKRSKNKLQPIIDFDGDSPLRQTIDIEELKLQSPYQEVSKGVKDRLQFLLEVNSSLTYHYIILALKEDSPHKFLPIEDLEAEQSSKDAEEEMLSPMEVKRSQSVQVHKKPQ